MNRIRISAIGGLALLALLAGSVPGAFATTSCSASAAALLSTGQVVLAGATTAKGAYQALVYDGGSNLLQRIALLKDGRFTELAAFPVVPGIEYFVVFADRRGRTLCTDSFVLSDQPPVVVN